MTNQNQSKLDTPVPLEYIKGIAAGFNKVKQTMNLPPGDWWGKDQSKDFYNGMLSGLQSALNGLSVMDTVPGATKQSLYNELSLMLGEVANLIVEKQSKIITLEK